MQVVILMNDPVLCILPVYMSHKPDPTNPDADYCLKVIHTGVGWVWLARITTSIPLGSTCMHGNDSALQFYFKLYLAYVYKISKS